MFNLIVELIIPLEISNKETKAEMDIHIVTGKTKAQKCSMQFRVVRTILYLLLKDSFCSISLIK